MTPEAASGLYCCQIILMAFLHLTILFAFIGNYNNGAAALDNLMYNTPYYTASVCRWK